MVFFLLLKLLPVDGQQYHYSQYFSSPLQMNPAITGYFSEGIRFSSVYRNQWSVGGNPFKTYSASIENRLFPNSQANKLGVGLVLVSDQSNNNAFSVNAAAFSTAFNIALTEDGSIELGAGLQAQLNQRKIDPFRLTFASQFQNGGFNTSIMTPEMLKASTIMYMSFNGGLLLNLKSDIDNSLYLGVSVYNLNSPQTNIMDQVFNEPVRLNLQAGGKMILNDHTLIQLSSNASFQNGSSEVLIGGVGSFVFGDVIESKKIMMGSWYRVSDAIIPYFGLQWGGYLLGFSYDIIVSKLKEASGIRNSFEMSFSYTNSKNRKNGGMPCFVF